MGDIPFFMNEELPNWFFQVLAVPLDGAFLLEGSSIPLLTAKRLTIDSVTEPLLPRKVVSFLGHIRPSFIGIFLRGKDECLPIHIHIRFPLSVFRRLYPRLKEGALASTKR